MIMVCIICHESTLERHQPRFERIYQAEGSQEQINDSCIESMRRISQVTDAEGWGGEQCYVEASRCRTLENRKKQCL